MKFDLEEAIKLTNQLVYEKFQRHLTDLEIIVFKGAWNRQEYDEIAAQQQYAATYISQDIAPKLWKLLTETLGEKVKKSNFKEALKRHWDSQHSPEQSWPQPGLAPGPASAPVAIPAGLEPQTEPTDLYIERPPTESICYKTLLESGALIRIKAPRFMGKTYLMTKVLERLATIDYRTATLSLQMADRTTHFTNLNKLLRWFASNLSRSLGLASPLDDYWDEEGMGAKVSCTTYLEEYLLPQTDHPLVLGIDDVDLLFPHPEVYQDFFGLLRSWYEMAKMRPLWKQLRLVLAHTTDVYIQLNIHQSPFNVGLPIELAEFSLEQVHTLACGYGLANQPDLVTALMALVGGHPYLLQQAFSYLKTQPDLSLSAMLDRAPTEAGIYSSHLRQYWFNLRQHPDLAIAFQQVIAATEPVQIEPLAAYQLHSMGLIKWSGKYAEPRCQLYRSYFGDRFRLFA